VRIRADLSEPALVLTADEPWVPSPAAGVERKLLDRDGAEQGRATSIVRYAPGSAFPEHGHPGGEELLVLSGVFSDERGDYPAGTYVRNPIGTRHTPRSDPGCVLFVKLCRFDAADTRRVAIDTRSGAWEPGICRGAEVRRLHKHGEEEVLLARWAPGVRLARHRHPRGAEVLVLEGAFADERGTYPTGAWIRSPAGSSHAPWTEGGCVLYVKRGHLPP